MEALQDFQLPQTIAGLWCLAIVVFVWAMVNQISPLEPRNVHFRSLSGSEPHTHGFCFSNCPNLLWRGIDLSDVFIYRVLKVHMYFFKFMVDRLLQCHNLSQKNLLLPCTEATMASQAWNALSAKGSVPLSFPTIAEKTTYVQTFCCLSATFLLPTKTTFHRECILLDSSYERSSTTSMHCLQS